MRGVANADLTPEFVLGLGRAAARVLGGPCFLIGRDTRISGPLLQAALTAGLAAEGVAVVDLGVLPTPGVAALAAADGLPAAMISASHNRFSDNGIKLFAAGGRKLADTVEARLTEELGKGVSVPARALSGAAVGAVRPDPGGRERYQQMVITALAGQRLDGLRVVLDCANGAACETGPALLRLAGADVVAVIGDQPDGVNINEQCGSTYPAALQAAVVETGADAGLALDGDADRVIAVDHTGAIIDGDQMIAALTLDRMDRGLLAGGTVVVTVMTNLGFHLAMAERGVAVHTTPVGDRSVLEALDRGGWSLGGEQSGHVIFRDLATTGDGVLTGLQLLDAVVRQGRPLATLAGEAMSRLPQVLRNVPVAHPAALADAIGVWDEVRAVEAGFGAQGRVVLRGSGTEALVRVMVEAPTHAEAEAAAAHLADVVAKAIG